MRERKKAAVPLSAVKDAPNTLVASQGLFAVSGRTLSASSEEWKPSRQALC